MGMKVLWVDDNADLLVGLRAKLLERGDIEVDVALDYETALERLKSDRYDSVLIDLILPHAGLMARYGGLDLVRRIQAEYPGADRPSITILSVVAPPAPADLTELGVRYFGKVELSEPGRLDELIQVVTKERS